MKLNLLYNESTLLSGHTNVDPFAKDGDPNKVKGAVENLDWTCETSEAETLIATDVIGFFPGPQIASIIDNWISKIRHGGKIIIGGVDLEEVVRATHAKQLTSVQANILLYGDQKDAASIRRSTFSSEDISKSLKECGFQLIKTRFNTYKYIVEAQRP